eukprot:TRINITY_DN66420_c1_g1_i1.p1 TRINITY_DN66420_c1_g1~~TRINITY_DN66420_c1_g1_i1.p1  ORF type:complete len:849 (-),score=431.91 TRINITY_DN66420_c1_g1_i1:5-2551(-)
MADEYDDDFDDFEEHDDATPAAPPPQADSADKPTAPAAAAPAVPETKPEDERDQAARSDAEAAPKPAPLATTKSRSGSNNALKRVNSKSGRRAVKTMKASAMGASGSSLTPVPPSTANVNAAPAPSPAPATATAEESVKDNKDDENDAVSAPPEKNKDNAPPPRRQSSKRLSGKSASRIPVAAPRQGREQEPAKQEPETQPAEQREQSTHDDGDGDGDNEKQQKSPSKRRSRRSADRKSKNKKKKKQRKSVADAKPALNPLVSTVGAKHNHDRNRRQSGVNGGGGPRRSPASSAVHSRRRVVVGGGGPRRGSRNRSRGVSPAHSAASTGADSDVGHHHGAAANGHQPIGLHSISIEHKDQVISKLRLRNDQLRHKLQTYSIELEESRRKNTLQRKSSTIELQHQHSEDVREKELENAQKRVDMYRKANAQLRRQVKQSLNPERLDHMHNRLAMASREIERLKTENRTLASENRRLEKEFKKNMHTQGDYPERIALLLKELRGHKEKIREMTARRNEADKVSRRQQDHMVNLENRVRRLQNKIKKLRKHGATENDFPVKELEESRKREKELQEEVAREKVKANNTFARLQKQLDHLREENRRLQALVKDQQSELKQSKRKHDAAVNKLARSSSSQSMKSNSGGAGAAASSPSKKQPASPYKQNSAAAIKGSPSSKKSGGSTGGSSSSSKKKKKKPSSKKRGTLRRGTSKRNKPDASAKQPTTTTTTPSAAATTPSEVKEEPQLVAKLDPKPPVTAAPAVKAELVDDGQEIEEEVVSTTPKPPEPQKYPEPSADAEKDDEELPEELDLDSPRVEPMPESVLSNDTTVPAAATTADDDDDEEEEYEDDFIN